MTSLDPVQCLAVRLLQPQRVLSNKLRAHKVTFLLERWTISAAAVGQFRLAVYHASCVIHAWNITADIALVSYPARPAVTCAESKPRHFKYTIAI